MATDHYLYATVARENKAGFAFYKVASEELAEKLCEFFRAEYGDEKAGHSFFFRPAGAMALKDQVLAEEEIQCAGAYSDPDRGIYYPDDPGDEVWTCGQYSVRAQKWQSILEARGGAASGKGGKPQGSDTGGEGASVEPDALMSPADTRNATLGVLMLLAQAYYKMLESVVGVGCAALDMELNQSYIWTVSNIENLLKNKEFEDFPLTFTPIVPDLYPSTIQDWEWSDMMAPKADEFLSAVQRYVIVNGLYEPPEKSLPWVFVEMFRPGVNNAIERADKYRKRMRQAMDRMLGKTTAKSGGEPSTGDENGPAQGNGTDHAQPPSSVPTKPFGQMKDTKGSGGGDPENDGTKWDITVGRLSCRRDFGAVQVGSDLYDLQTRTQARLCIKYLVENKAFDPESARHFTDEIDPFVRQHSTAYAANDPKIDHYFNDPEGKLPALRKVLIQKSGRRDGRYFLKVK